MRRAAVLLVALAALLLAAPLAPAVAPRMLPVAWRLAEAGPRGRSVVLLYEAGGCPPTPLITRVHATRSSIRISLFRTVPERPIICPLIGVPRRATVHLAQPIRGRTIRGASEYAPAPLPCPPAGRCSLRTPRVVGLAPGDARAVLRQLELKVRVRRGGRRGGRVRILGQRPKAHATVGRTRTVRLVRSRTG